MWLWVRYTVHNISLAILAFIMKDINILIYIYTPAFMPDLIIFILSSLVKFFYLTYIEGKKKKLKTLHVFTF